MKSSADPDQSHPLIDALREGARREVPYALTTGWAKLYQGRAGTPGVLPLKGKVVTGDAMFTPRDVCAKVIDGGAITSCCQSCRSRTTSRRSAGTSRRPSPALRPAFLPLEAARRAAEVDRACEVDKGHARIETRSIEVTSSLAESLESDWPDCAQVYRLMRVRKTAAKVETEVGLGITSLPRERGGAKELLRLTRAHWSIENGLHGVRDGPLREDASRVRKGAAAEVMAALRNIVIFWFKRAGHESAAAATQHFVCHPKESLEVLSTPR